MNKLKTIVIEDERLPRLSLLSKLEAYRHALEVVDACDTYESARESILRHRPDLLFLDIQLGGRDSIQLLEELRRTISLPYVIFTTAYSDRRYLMSAIKLSAVDYLLKPVGKEELAYAIAKAVDRAGAYPDPRDVAPQKLAFRSASGRLFAAPEEIAGFKAEGNYATLVGFSGSELILESLRSVEQRLPQGQFLRADRSTIVNLCRIYRLNVQQHTCTLRSGDGREQVLKVTRNGMDLLLAAEKPA